MKGNMEETSDDNLVELAKQGDVEALTMLIHGYQERICHTVFALTRNHLVFKMSNVEMRPHL